MKDGFRIYDTHTHAGVARHSGRSHSIDELLGAMDRHGIDRSLVIPFPVVDDERAAHDLIGRAVKAYPDRLRGAACLYPYTDEQAFRDELRRCREVYGFTVLKLQPQYQPLNTLWPTSRFYFEAAAELGFTIVCHTGSGMPYALPSMMMIPARDYPGMRFVLAHCGGGLLAPEAIVAASFCPNIYLELSSLLPNQIHEVLRHVPSTRLMIGSDLAENLEMEIGKILTLDAAVADRRNILWDTAAGLFE